MHCAPDDCVPPIAAFMHAPVPLGPPLAHQPHVYDMSVHDTQSVAALHVTAGQVVAAFENLVTTATGHAVLLGDDDVTPSVVAVHAPDDGQYAHPLSVPMQVAQLPALPTTPHLTAVHVLAPGRADA